MRLFFVVGMHRSGTSALTRVINLLGPSVGPEDALIRPNDRNPRGYWERTDVYRLNERILAFLGGSWEHPPDLDFGWERSPSMRPWLAEIEEILQALVDNDEDDDYLIKDPRLSLTLPLWHLAQTPSRVIMAVRDPIHVCQSLESRNDMTPREASDLWLMYIASALENVRTPVVVAYNDLLEDTGATVDRLIRELALQPASTRPAVDSVRKELDHGYVRDESAHVEEANVVYQALLTGDVDGARHLVRQARARNWERA